MAGKIVVTTAGGHISCFHAAFGAMHDALRESGRDLRLFGSRGGVLGLNEGIFEPILREHIDENRAGSMFGADRNHVKPDKVIEAAQRGNVYAVITMGGDNHQKEANELAKAGVRIVGYPKTMDGDLNSGVTLGYDTAVTVGANAVRNHHNSAITYERIFYVGLFGRDTDWVPCAVSAYGGSERSIPCEKTYFWEQIWARIDESIKRNKEIYGKRFAVIPFSEGARIKEIPSPPEEFCERDAHGEVKLRPEWIAMNLELLTKRSGFKSASQVYTYSMRDSPPTETDKKLSAIAGRECIKMILEGDFGKGVAFSPHENFYRVERRPLEEVAMKRVLANTGYFDYHELKHTPKFVTNYGALFKNSLGSVPSKDSLVYRNLVRR